jgi:hypothetical protein
LISLIAIPYASISQNSKPNKPDTTCIPNATLKEAVALIEEGRIAKKEIELLREKVAVLTEQLRVKDSTISLFARRENDLMAISNNFDRYVESTNTQISNLTEMYKVSRNETKKERRKKWLATIGGILTTAVTLLLK